MMVSMFKIIIVIITFGFSLSLPKSLEKFMTIGIGRYQVRQIMKFYFPWNIAMSINHNNKLYSLQKTGSKGFIGSKHRER